MNKNLLVPVFLILGITILLGFVSATPYPSPFVVNDYADVAIIYGTSPEASSLELVYAGNLQTDLQNKVSTSLESALAKDSEINSVSHHNLILIGSVGNGCSNSAFEKILGKSCGKILEDSGIGSGQFLIEVVNNPFQLGKVVLLIEGYQATDVVNAVNYLMNESFDISVGSKYRSISKVSNLPVSPTTFGSPGTYNIKPGDKISFSGSSVFVDQIKLDDNNVSWNFNFNKPMVYFSTQGIGAKIHAGESAGILPTPVARESIIGIRVNSIDIGNQVASASFVDVTGLRNTGSSIPESYFLDNSKENKTVSVKCNDSSCPYGCEEGVCKEKTLSEIVGKIKLIYDENYITPLDLTILSNLQAWLSEKEIESEIKKNNEIVRNDLNNKIIVFVYNMEAVVIYGANVSSPLTLVWAGNIKNYLYEMQGNQLLFVCPELAKSSDSDDLKDYFCKKILNPFNSEEPIEISNEDTFNCRGCKLDAKCYPFGYRKGGKYCSDGLEFINQSEESTTCDNNFECSSNVCVSSKCISEGFIQKILNWFKRIFGG